MASPLLELEGTWTEEELAILDDLERHLKENPFTIRPIEDAA